MEARTFPMLQILVFEPDLKAKTLPGGLGPWPHTAPGAGCGPPRARPSSRWGRPRGTGPRPARVPAPSCPRAPSASPSACAACRGSPRCRTSGRSARSPCGRQSSAAATPAPCPPFSWEAGPWGAGRAGQRPGEPSRSPRSWSPGPGTLRGCGELLSLH